MLALFFHLFFTHVMWDNVDATVKWHFALSRWEINAYWLECDVKIFLCYR